MGKIFYNIFLTGIIMSASSYQALACEVNLEVDINITTKYINCEHYARSVVEMCKLCVAPDLDPEMKAYFLGQVSYFKKKLDSCEKRNKKKTKDTHIKGGAKKKF